MWNCYGPLRRCRDNLSRRDVLQVGALALPGLMLGDVLRLQARAATASARPKSVIMIWMRGGPSHIDSVDMKPEAPPEIRGEFRPIATNVPGVHICEYMPRLSQMMDKLAIVRGIKSNDLGDHTPHYILTGSPDRGKRPAFGSVVSYLQPNVRGLPPYVSLMYDPPRLYDNEGPLYLGESHRPFAPRDGGLANLRRPQEVSLDRLRDRRELLRTFDVMRQQAEHHAAMSGVDAFNQRAVEMTITNQARDAFDLSQESPGTYERYGKYCENFLIAAGWSRPACRSSRSRSATGTRTKRTSATCASNCRSSTTASTPWSAICTTAVCTTTWPWCCGASSAALDASRAVMGATTGPRPAPQFSPAADSKPAR